ncbi:hypothetical protein WICMUC_004813 [Wickerhamomyces mucosus]|uniref:DNA-binding protein RAP1 n=1 Tax=Wickerhamomyces mucosus TaxID=1378264 RepID=A0A9P8PGH1_9ASCO|nr:hypothetical protein WICMUC_004813 [Wickerhamomyces mucosus]
MTDNHSDFVTSSKDDNSNIDNALLEQQNVSTLFIGNDESPLVFYISSNETDRDTLISLVEQHGGRVTENVNEGYYISKFNESSKEVIDPRFIYESVEKKSFLPISQYRISTYVAPEPSTATVAVAVANADNNDRPTDNQSHGVEQLVDYLKEKQEKPTISDQQQSPTSEVSSSTAIPTSVQTAGRSYRSNASNAAVNKNGFTDEEDEIILETVRENPSRRSTHKLFQEIAEKLGKHTGNSIRYRFRTHLSPRLEYVYIINPDGSIALDSDGKRITTTQFPGTLKTKFTALDDYTLCKAVREALSKKIPVRNADINPDQVSNPTDVLLPGKFFDFLAEDHKNHTRAAWRDRFRKFAVPYGIDRFIQEYELALEEGKEPVEIKNFTGKNLYKSTKSFLRGEIDDGYGRLSQKNQHKRAKKAIDQQSQESTPLQQSEPSNNLFDHPALSQLGYTQSQQQTAESAVANAFGQLPNPLDFLTDDLVTAKFFQFDPISSVVDVVTDIITKKDYSSGDAEGLINDLYEGAGIQKKFGTFIITAVCGDLILIPKYMKRFLETAENPPSGIEGVWTPYDDEILMSNDLSRMEELRIKHGDRRIEIRKNFFSEDYAGEE